MAFIARDGYYQTCGVYAPLYDEPELEYEGNGAVTFKLLSREGEPYNCRVTFSEEEIDGTASVRFTVEDDLGKL